MKCTEIHELLPDLAAGFASAPPGINDHLRSCADCTGKLEEFRKTMALLDEWQAPEPSPYFDTRLMARVREERAKPQRSPWFSWFRMPVLAAGLALVLMMGGGVTWFTHRGGTSIGAGNNPPNGPVQPTVGTAVGDLQT